jgi:hypothetical protein
MQDGAFMDIKSAKVVVVAVFLSLGFCGVSFAETKAPQSQSGRVLTATLSGHGPSSESKTKRASTNDIWWNYCIDSGDNLYAVVSRESPEKTGLKPDKTVRFTEDIKQIYITVKGKSLALRILRKSKDKECP